MSAAMMGLAGKVAVITGGSRGIGRAVARCLAENGAKVVVNYLSQAEAARETAELLESLGAEALLCKGDVSRLADAEALVAAALERFGRLDYIFATREYGRALQLK